MAQPAQDQLDTRALEVSTAALTKIEQHITDCEKRDDRRWQEAQHARQEAVQARQDIKASIATIHQRIDKLVGRWFAAAAGLIAVLLTLLGYLLVNGVPWGGT